MVENEGYALAFVELDDQGELWSPQQVVRAVELIRNGSASPQGAILVVFIHGWGHDAAPGDDNIAGLENLLAQIERVERGRGPADARRIIGVYVGWRGKSTRLPLLHSLTFLSRFRGAKRVASTATTEMLYRLLLAGRSNPSNTTVAVGHSFGGLILESALAQAAIGALGRTAAEGAREIEFPADLVLLINPASQAIEAKQLVDVFERYHLKFQRGADAGSLYDVPLVVSATSSADVATRVFFPLGMRLRGVGNRFRSYGPESCARGRQATYFRRTAGNQRVLHSHLVEVERIAKRGSDLDALRAASGPARVEHAYDPETRLETWTVDGVELRYRIHQNPRSWNDTPYWIMEVPPAVFPDHSRIFGWETIEFAGALIAMTGAMEGTGGRARLVTDDGVKPVLIATRSDGVVSFLDRSQRIFEIGAEALEPRFASCVPDALTGVADVIGAAGTPESAWIAGTLRGYGKRAGEKRIGVVKLVRAPSGTTGPAAPAGPASVDRSLPRGVDAAAAAFDLARGTMYLARSDTPTLDRVDLSRRQLAPETLLDLGEGGALAHLVHDARGGRLFGSDGRSSLVAIDLESSPPRVERIAEELAFPSALAWDADRGLLHAATAGDGALWRVECAPTCGTPTRLDGPSELRHPRSMAVDRQGTIWVADLESRIIVGLSPDGEVVRRIERLPQAAF